MAIEQEAVWLRPRIIQMRAMLRRVKDRNVENALREFIADAESRLEALEERQLYPRVKLDKSRVPQSN